MPFRWWAYEIRDKDTHMVLKSDSEFDTEEDAGIQAEMDARVENIKNFYIRTFQPPYEG